MCEALPAAGTVAAAAPVVLPVCGGSPVDDGWAAIAAALHDRSSAMTAELPGAAERLEDRFFNGAAVGAPDDGEDS